MSAAAVVAKAASVILGDERGRRAVGWILVAVFSPLILLIAILCGLGAGSAAHNHSAVDACFFGTVLPQDTPQEYRTHVAQMRSAFSVLDSAVAGVNTITEGGSLDPIRIKAVFCALCFGEDAPSQRAASRFVECFYTLEERSYPVELLDENGRLSWTADSEVKVEVTGGAVIGTGTGRNDDDHVYTDPTCRAYHGRLLAAIRPEEPDCAVVVTADGFSTGMPIPLE